MISIIISIAKHKHTTSVCYKFFLQLRKSAQDLKNCAENYHKLYQSAFDADPGSLTNIRAYPFTGAIFI